MVMILVCKTTVETPLIGGKKQFWLSRTRKGTCERSILSAWKLTEYPWLLHLIKYVLHSVFLCIRRLPVSPARVGVTDLSTTQRSTVRHLISPLAAPILTTASHLVTGEVNSRISSNTVYPCERSFGIVSNDWSRLLSLISTSIISLYLILSSSCTSLKHFQC